MRIAEVPDPKIDAPTDAIIKVTSTAICGSDLHLYEVLCPYLNLGDVLGQNRWESSRRWVPTSSISNPGIDSWSRAVDGDVRPGHPDPDGAVPRAPVGSTRCYQSWPLTGIRLGSSDWPLIGCRQKTRRGSQDVPRDV